MRYLAFLLAIGPSFGQVTTGSISGFVLDPDRKPVANAAVTATDNGRSIGRTARSDSAGFYRFVDLPPSDYTLASSVDKFQPVAIPRVAVLVNSVARVDFHLQLAGMPQSVTVTIPAHGVQLESSDLGMVIEEERIRSLPLNRRDFLQLALLVPGVLPPVEDSELSTRGSFAMHANGAREEYNNYLLDGVDNNDQVVNRYVLQPSVDAIREFKIAVSGYSAEYGRSAGAQVNVITRSGTNQVHGFATEYLRNRALDAPNFFDGAGKAKYIRNQFSAGIGGPIARDRTFLFASFEGLRERQGLTRLGTVPTASIRAGDFTGTGTVVVDPFTQQPFPDNRIPAARISPLAAKVLSLFPAANRPGTSGNYFSQPVRTDQDTQASVRLDHQLSASSQLTLRYSFGARALVEPFAEDSTDIPGFGDRPNDHGQNAMVHYLQTISPAIINSLTLGFNRGTRRLTAENDQVDVNGLWGVSYLPTRSRDFGYPGITVAGYSHIGDLASLPIDRAATTYQVREGLSVMRGAHAVKVGVELRKLQMNGVLDMLTRGSMSFSGAFTKSGLGDLLLGFPSFALQSQAENPQTQRTSAVNAYVQDDWKVGPKLTLNLGLRYEYNTPVTDPADRMSVFDLSRFVISQVGRNGISRSGYEPSRRDFGPRVGLAWTPAQSFVVRAGYGVYYDSGMTMVNSSLYFNPPYFSIRAFFPTQSSLLSLNNPFPATGGFLPPASLSTLSPDCTTAYLQHWNLNLVREFGRAGVASLAYAGSKGTHLVRSRDINQARPGPGEVADRVPYPGFSNIMLVESGANSNYHALQASFNRPLGGGVSVLAAYTLSKSIDDTSAFLSTKSDKNFPQDSRNYRAERSLSSFDIHQRASVAGVYRLPGRSIWLRDTESRTIVTAQSGQPFTPLLRFDNSNTGNTGGSFGSDRPDLLRSTNLDGRGPDRWFDTSAFAVPAPFHFGSAGRGVVRSPGLVTVDVSMVRRVPLGDRKTLSIEAEAFNLFNRTNLDLPERYADEAGTFGHIYSARAPRQIQVALRLQF